MNVTEADTQRRLYLRAAVKLLFAVGFLFALLPFFKSIPWGGAELPADAVVVEAASFAPGATRLVRLNENESVFVTRSSPELRAALAAFPGDALWFPSAPGLAEQPWLVLRSQSALDEPLRFLPAAGAWPGGFVADSGAAWDLAGRALKPGPAHPSGHAMKVQNLLPMPFRRHGDDLALMPPATAAQSSGTE
jgi:hypothetical protein